MLFLVQPGAAQTAFATEGLRRPWFFQQPLRADGESLMEQLALILDETRDRILGRGLSRKSQATIYY
jgi:hypothetical protein